MTTKKRKVATEDVVYERIVITFNPDGSMKGGAVYPYTDEGGIGEPTDLPLESEQLNVLGEVSSQAAQVAKLTKQLETANIRVQTLESMMELKSNYDTTSTAND